MIVVVYDYKTQERISNHWVITSANTGDYVLREEISSWQDKPSNKWEDNMYVIRQVVRTAGDYDIIFVTKYTEYIAEVEDKYTKLSWKLKNLNQ